MREAGRPRVQVVAPSATRGLFPRSAAPPDRGRPPVHRQRTDGVSRELETFLARQRRRDRTVPRFVLVPLPSRVPVTCSPTSRRWSWFPPEAHIHTGRLRSAASGRHPVPRRQRSYAALRLPRLVGRGSGSPCQRPTSMRTLFFTASARSACARASEKGSPDSPWLREVSRKTRASQVPGPSSSCVPWSKTPPGAFLPSPDRGEAAVAFRSNNALGTRKEIVFEAIHPRPTRSRAYASPVALPPPGARLATGSGGLTPGRTGFAPVGRLTKFHEVIACFTPLRPALPGRTEPPIPESAGV